MLDKSIAIDLSDLPEETPASIRAFISHVRLGYSTKHGTFSGWQRAIKKICKSSPVMHFVMCVAIGSLMRPLLKDMPGGILYLHGPSTTGKSIALQTALSLRADPSDMTWGFDSMATLKWYTIAAENNFLCLDDIHMAILPDNDSSRPVSSSYFQWFDSRDAPHTTIIATGVPNLRSLAGREVHNALEIDAVRHPFWTPPAKEEPWWMDSLLAQLKYNYGRAHDRIQDSIAKDSQYWMQQYQTNWCTQGHIQEPGKRSLLIQALMGNQWLHKEAKVDIEADASWLVLFS